MTSAESENRPVITIYKEGELMQIRLADGSYMHSHETIKWNDIAVVIGKRSMHKQDLREARRLLEEIKEVSEVGVHDFLITVPKGHPNHLVAEILRYPEDFVNQRPRTC